MYLKDPSGKHIWKPSVKQERFLSIPLSIKEGFYAGALMAGKTEVLVMYPLVHQWVHHPMFKGLFLRRTMPELRNEVLPRAKEYFKPFGAKFNKTDSCFTFPRLDQYGSGAQPSGGLFFFSHCEHEDDVHDFDSMQPNYAAFDELTSFTEYIYQYIVIERVRVPEHLKDELPMIARSASNPGNVGHQFTYKRFIKPYPQGGKIIVGRGGVKRIYIPATIDDNPHASQQYKRELDALPEAERKAKKYGDWDAYDGLVFDELRDKKYPGEPENALHVVEKFDIPNHWPKVIAIDWGMRAMTSIGFGAISPNRRVYIYRHLHFTGKKIEYWAPILKHYVDSEMPVEIVICHSASQDRGQPHTIHQQVSEALDYPVSLGEKDRIAGKVLIHEYLRWESKPVPEGEKEEYDPEFAVWVLHNKGEVEYHKYLSLFKEPEKETNLPKLLFFDDPDIKLIIEALKACNYVKSDKTGKAKEDVAEFKGDDPYDMLRMLLTVVDNFFDVAKSEQEKLDKKNAVIKRFEETKDMTAYYRNMRRLEMEERVEPVMLSRYQRNYPRS